MIHLSPWKVCTFLCIWYPLAYRLDYGKHFLYKIYKVKSIVIYHNLGERKFEFFMGKLISLALYVSPKLNIHPNKIYCLSLFLFCHFYSIYISLFWVISFMEVSPELKIHVHIRMLIYFCDLIREKIFFPLFWKSCIWFFLLVIVFLIF